MVVLYLAPSLAAVGKFSAPEWPRMNHLLSVCLCCLRSYFNKLSKTGSAWCAFEPSCCRTHVAWRRLSYSCRM